MEKEGLQAQDIVVEWKKRKTKCSAIGSKINPHLTRRSSKCALVLKASDGFGNCG